VGGDFPIDFHTRSPAKDPSDKKASMPRTAMIFATFAALNAKCVLQAQRRPGPPDCTRATRPPKPTERGDHFRPSYSTTTLVITFRPWVESASPVTAETQRSPPHCQGQLEPKLKSRHREPWPKQQSPPLLRINIKAPDDSDHIHRAICAQLAQRLRPAPFTSRGAKTLMADANPCPHLLRTKAAR